MSDGKIYAAIAGVIADVGYVAKDKVNRTQGFKFRSVDDVYNALHPALAKNKVFIVPRIMERKCEVIGKTKNGVDMVKVVCEIEFTFFAEDGSNIKAVIIGEGLDTGDKATNKAMAIAYKYACFQVFCIPTEELMDDPDHERPELEAAKKEPVKNNKAGSKKTATDKTENKVSVDDGSASKEDASKEEMVTEAMINTIRSEQKRTGVVDKQILGRKGIKAKSIEELTVVEYKRIMDVFAITPDLPGGVENE